MVIDFENIEQTEKPSEVLETALCFLERKHKKKELSFLVDKALTSLYRLMEVDQDHSIVITSSHTEAINHIVLATYFDITRKTGKNHFITSRIDEAAPIMAMGRLQDFGSLFEFAPVNEEGMVTYQTMVDTITPRTALISLSYANALTGVIQPVAEIGQLCQERGIYFHVDVSHAIGKAKLSFKDLNADFVTFNGELIGALPGASPLFIKKGVNISPLILGSSEQGGLRGGSYNLPAFFAFCKACEIAMQDIDFCALERARLRHLFETDLIKKIPRASVLFQNSLRVPHITAIDFPHVTSDALLFFLSRKQLFASQGGGAFQKISHILKASHIHSESALSFSFSPSISDDIVFQATSLIEEAYLFLKKTTTHL